MRAVTLARLGCDSKIFGSRPTSARRPATCSAAWRSPGPEWSPGLVVSILIRSRQIATTSSSAVSWLSVTWFSVTFPWSHPGGRIVRSHPRAGGAHGRNPSGHGPAGRPPRSHRGGKAAATPVVRLWVGFGLTRVGSGGSYTPGRHGDNNSISRVMVAWWWLLH